MKNLYKSKILKLFLLIVFFSSFWVFQAKGQTTYNWQGIDGADWTVSTNWNPTRSTPATTDILQPNNMGTYFGSNVTTQSIRHLIHSNNQDLIIQKIILQSDYKVKEVNTNTKKLLIFYR